MAAAPGNMYGALQMLCKMLMVMTTTVTFAHADLEAECQYQVLLEMTTFVTQVIQVPQEVVYSSQIMLSGMDRAVTTLNVVAITPHRGSVRNSLTLPLMTLRSGSVLMKVIQMKTLPLN